MSISKRNTILIIIIFIIAISSLIMSIYSARKADNGRGVATLNVTKFSCELSDIRDFNNSINTSIFLKEPRIDNNSIVYGVSLLEVGAHSQFYFTLSNKGTEEVVIDSINVTGLEGYQDNVTVTIQELNAGDVILPASNINVKVSTDYKKKYTSEDGDDINLNNIKIVINYKE